MRRQSGRHREPDARLADLAADAVENMDMAPAVASASAGMMDAASRLGARLEETLMANSLIWVDILEGGGGRANTTLVGSFQLEFNDGLGLRLVRTDGGTFAEWDLRDFALSLVDGDIFGRHVVLTGRDKVTYSFPALPDEDAERLLEILTEAREAAAAGSPVAGEE